MHLVALTNLGKHREDLACVLDTVSHTEIYTSQYSLFLSPPLSCVCFPFAHASLPSGLGVFEMRRYWLSGLHLISAFAVLQVHFHVVIVFPIFEFQSGLSHRAT
jgi:uncharacterized membrane protein YfhO